MCGLCGIVGGEAHWTDRAGGHGALGDSALTRRRERQQRVAVVNRVLAPFRLKVGDWNNALVLSSPTGRREMVDALAHVWAPAERLAGRPLDPLDAALLDALEADGRP
ncbi:MAG: hypothetical protein ACFCVH_05740 [Alphaproteobacteria bacterium]